MDELNEPSLTAATTALLLIDFQEDVAGTGAGDLHPWAVPAVERAAEAADWARNNGIPVVWVRVERRPDYSDVFAHKTDTVLAGKGPQGKRLVAGSPGAQLVPSLVVQPEDRVIVKPRVNAFYGTSLEVVLRRLGTTTVLLGGVYTNMGVEATARCAYDRDLHVVVISDCCAAYSPDVHDHAISKTFPRIGRVRTLDAVKSLLTEASR